MITAARRSVLALALAAGCGLALSAPARAQGFAADSLAPAPAPDANAFTSDSSVVATASDSLPPAAASAHRADFNPRSTVGRKLVRLTGKPESAVRSGPGNGFALVGTWPAGTSFPVIARSGAWYGVRVSETATGWVHASLCREMDDLSGLEYRPNAKLYTRTGSMVLGGYGGAYAYDRKSNSAVFGGRIGYYVFDRVIAEAGVSWSHVNRPAEIVESLFGLQLEAEDFSMLFYQMNLTWELLPGRQMVPYVGGGAGSTVMLGRSVPSVNFGAGTRMFVSRRTAVRWDVRDYRFEDTSGSHHTTNNNVEFTIGSEILF